MSRPQTAASATPPASPRSTARLAASAAYILRDNDIGAMTAAAPGLYPHLWSWDAAIVSIGLAALSVPRAIAELRSLLRAQWRTGMLPHIVFADNTSYFPGPDVWASDTAAAAPRGVRTSGICQPPVHALAVRRILDTGRRRGGADRQAAERFVAETFDAWLAWHRWLDVRDPDRRGLIEIYHGWESGMDNSPRWDAAYAGVHPDPDRIDPAALGRRRSDLAHVSDGGQRPSDEEYLRYLWLVHQMRRAGYDDAAVRERVDFRVGDAFLTAVAAVAGDVLAGIGAELGRDEQAAELREQAARFRAGVLRTVSPHTGLARDFNVRTGGWLETETIGGFAPLVCGGDAAVVAGQARLLAGERWCAHPGLRYRVPPSTSPASEAFRPRQYWRGPQWPVMNWLLSQSLIRHGQADLAADLREQALRQLDDLTFGEYYEPFTGESLGSAHQSWTAAVALDWLAG